MLIIRYLSQLSDQMYCFAGKDQLADLDLSGSSFDDDDSDSGDEADATFDFTVQRMNQKEERVHLVEEGSNTVSISHRS